MDTHLLAGSPLKSSSSPQEELAMLPLADQQPTGPRTLASQESEFVIRRKKPNKAQKSKFLSHVGEIDSDVQYRFNFTVVGDAAGGIVHEVCNSPSALALGGVASVKSTTTDAMHRCMCQPFQDSSVAKLAFTTHPFDDVRIGCNTQQEALSTVVVYAMDVDQRKPDGESTFPEQLQRLHRTVTALRSKVKSQMRPVKALLLCCHGHTPKTTLESWALDLADYEQAHGSLWKFGPVNAQDANALYAIFTEMTSCRLLHQTSSPAAGFSEEGEDDGPVNENSCEMAFVPSAGAVEARPKSPCLSSASEQEHPPRFTAESCGSECSDNTLEVHAKTFGLSIRDVMKEANRLPVEMDSMMFSEP